MKLWWEVLRRAVPLIWQGNPYLFSVVWFTIQVAVIATVIAAALGLPLGLLLGLGRFRGRRVLALLANASLAVPPVLVGLLLFLLFMGPLGSLHLILTRKAVFIAQAVLALPYVVALSAAAVQGLPPGLLGQARALRAGRRQLALLALREARIGVIAALIAALGSTLSEVGAIVIVGGNVYGFDQTLASAALYESDAAHFDDAVALGIVLIALILLLMGAFSLLQRQGDGIRWRLWSTG